MRHVSALPELWLFADTGDERASTMRHVEKMATMIERNGWTFKVVKRGEESLSEHVLRKVAAGEGGISMPPVFVESARLDARGEPVAAPVFRGCTRDFKSKVLDKAARAHFADHIKAGGVVAHWYGFSYDEPERLRTYTAPADRWRVAVSPLYDMRWARSRCEEYLRKSTYLPSGEPVAVVRSSCVFCPFHSAAEWRRLRAEDPEGWARAVEFDAALRAGKANGATPPAGLKSWPYVLRGRVPLGDAPLDDNQGSLFGFDEECSGVCGV